MARLTTFIISPSLSPERWQGPKPSRRRKVMTVIMTIVSWRRRTQMNLNSEEDSVMTARFFFVCFSLSRASRGKALDIATSGSPRRKQFGLRNVQLKCSRLFKHSSGSKCFFFFPFEVSFHHYHQPNTVHSGVDCCLMSFSFFPGCCGKMSGELSQAG